jgi:hypothetical protein
MSRLATGDGGTGAVCVTGHGAPHVRYGPHAARRRPCLITIDRSPTPLIVDSLRLGIVSLDDGTVTALGIAGTNPYYVASGHIVFGRPGGLVFSVPFSCAKAPSPARPGS